ncbi:MAG: tRNA lysidine(34) synthetase TilS [Novosphingobium meiothermophilum]|uniref:tRNA lysidine(34) synthetase TilS n=1 Tax=Novosphingobium meiothermophilum TaxID=2202251 RepID=UPI0022AA6332|nr:tRNA lysidine(34) synthetase TilS [Novosphingobium meiothermophilum]
MKAAAARFAAQWQALAPEGPVGLAVSGGADSLALMLLMQEVAPRNFRVATVDHGLRPESAGEAAMVGAHCARLGIAHQTLKVSLTKGAAIQERARAARYGALGGWCEREGLAALVTAHHADDQAETMVMRLNRGAGLRGLAAMRAVAPVPGVGGHRSIRLPLIRPLLSWRRAELAGLVQAAGLVAVDDPSNRDPRHERVRIRDAMTSAALFDCNGMAASAAHLADADAALEWMADRLWAEVAAETDAGQAIELACPVDLPTALCLRLLERVLARFGAPPPRGAELARWRTAMAAGGVATLGGVKGDARRGIWRFTRAPAHRR